MDAGGEERENPLVACHPDEGRDSYPVGDSDQVGDGLIVEDLMLNVEYDVVVPGTPEHFDKPGSVVSKKTAYRDFTRC